MSSHFQDKAIVADANVSVAPAVQHLTDEELAVTHQGDHGTKRDLKPRVVSMIAIAGTIGTGLFLGSGSALALGGPVGAWLGYTIMGALVGCMMYCLGEMTCFAPNIGGFVEMGTKYVSPHFGFMMGINYILQCGMAVPSELSAIAVMIGYWDDNSSHAGGYIAAFLVLAIITNILGVRIYGEIEFSFACIKVATLVGLIIFGLIADVGGIPPNHIYVGGRYWRDEPFNDTFKGITPVSTARFLGFWAVFTKAAFSYGGIESIGILAGEAHNPRRTMRLAVRTVFYRVVGIYMLAILMIGLNVSQRSPELLENAGKGTAASSPFVIICTQNMVNVLPSIINAVVMTSALSSCNENMYAVSRTMMALARNNGMPRYFLRTSKAGIPYGGVVVAFCFGLLAFLSLSDGSNKAFSWLSNLSALSSLVAWISICYCYVRFRKACDVQGVDRSALTLRAWNGLYLAWMCIAFFSLVLLFNGFTAFIGGFQISDFFASYVTLPLIGLCWIGYKFVRKTKGVHPDDIDLSAGPAEALRDTRYASGWNPGHIYAPGYEQEVPEEKV